MEFVDTHTHLDDDAFAGDLPRVLDESRSQGVTRWINVGYNEARWSSTLDLVTEVRGMYCMLGLHPGHADDWSDGLCHRLCHLIDSSAPVAVGEIGLDLHWRQDNLDLQRQSLRDQLEIARDRHLPAVIHMRAADAELLAELVDLPALPHLHFHSFDGDDRLREWVLSNDATIGVGGLVTRAASASLRSWVASLPRDRVVLETDAPYLKPKGVRGTRNQPAYLVRTARLLAAFWGVEVEDVAEVTTENAARVFRLVEVQA